MLNIEAVVGAFALLVSMAAVVSMPQYLVR
jgi:hypothetical protein